MTIANTLDHLRTSFDGVATLAFVDLSTKMVLCSSSNTSPNQEYLDALCVTAVEMLAGEIASQMAPVITQTETPTVQHAIIIQDSEVACFIRSAYCLDDAICAICAPNIDLAHLIPALSAKLDQLFCAQTNGAGL